jgi:hypothetical protein
MSPIVGETTENSHIDATRGMQRLGKIWKGDKRPADGMKPGPERPYFRFAFPETTADEQAIAERILYPAALKLYGDKPQIISGVYLIDPVVDQAFSTWYEQRGRTGMTIRCDGRSIHLQRDDTGHMIDFARMGLECPACMTRDRLHPLCDCVKVGRLRFFLEGMLRETGRYGFMEMETHSGTDRIHIHKFLTNLYETAGRIVGIPLELSRTPRDFTVQIKGKNSSVTKYMVMIRPDPAWARSALAQMLTNPTPLSLPAHIDPQTGEIHDSDDDPDPQDDPDVESGDGDGLNDWGAPDQVDVPAQQPEPETASLHWSDDPTKLLKLRRIIEVEGLPQLEALPDDWDDYPTGQAAINALRDLRKSAVPPPSDRLPAGDGLGTIDIGRLTDAFNVTDSAMLEIMDVQEWAELGTNAEARAKILGRALERSWPVIVTRCEYIEKPARSIKFDSVLGPIYWFKGRKELVTYAEGLGYDGPEWDVVATWKEGNHLLPDPLMIIWHKDDKTGRLDAVRFVKPIATVESPTDRG